MTCYLKGLTVALLSSAAFSTAASAEDARVTIDLHMRAGPSTEFPIVATIAEDAGVDVYGCIDDYNWCDVSWRGDRGWVSGDHLEYYYESRYVPIVEIGPRIEVPIVTFTFTTYWDEYYRDRPWYSRRDHWHTVWRGDRDDDDDRDRRRGDVRDDDRDGRQDARGDDDREQNQADAQDDDDAREERRRRQVRRDDRDPDQSQEDRSEESRADQRDDDEQNERRRRQVRGEEDRERQAGRGGPDQNENEAQGRRERQARGQDGGGGEDEELLRRRLQ